MKTITHNEVCELLLRYAANSITSDAIAEQLGADPHETAEILAVFQHDWDNTEVDEEGATTKQDAELDRLIDFYAADLLS